MRTVIHIRRQVNPTNTGVPSMMSRFEVVSLPARRSLSAAVGTPFGLAPPSSSRAVAACHQRQLGLELFDAPAGRLEGVGPVARQGSALACLAPSKQGQIVTKVDHFLGSRSPRTLVKVVSWWTALYADVRRARFEPDRAVIGTAPARSRRLCVTASSAPRGIGRIAGVPLHHIGGTSAVTAPAPPPSPHGANERTSTVALKLLKQL